MTHVPVASKSFVMALRTFSLRWAKYFFLSFIPYMPLPPSLLSPLFLYNPSYMPDLSYSSLPSHHVMTVPSHLFFHSSLPTVHPYPFTIPFSSVLSSSLSPSFPLPSRYDSALVPVLPPLSLFSFRPYFVISLLCVRHIDMTFSRS